MPYLQFNNNSNKAVFDNIKRLKRCYSITISNNKSNFGTRNQKSFILTLLLLLFIIFSTISSQSLVSAEFCYSCAGTCHHENCNCQMGSCEADYCFIEKKPAETAGLFRITKGCVKRPSRTRLGCDYDHFPNHVQCVCSGNFCNDAIMLRQNAAPLLRRNVTCRECSDRNADCGKTCEGEWCHEKVISGGSGCGYGPPSLPYFYKGSELLRHRNKICITLSRGNAAPHKYCICNTNMCNFIPQRQSFPFSLFVSNTPSPAFPQYKSRSVINYYHNSNKKETPTEKFYECVNCDLTAEQNSMTSGCKSNRCYGHFCIYATQRVFVNVNRMKTAALGSSNGETAPNGVPLATQAIIHEKQACMNVTDTYHVQLGCTHKWMNNEEEELYCACRGDNCNINLVTAAAAGLPSSRRQTFSLIFGLKIIIFLFIFWQNIAH